MLPEPEDFDGFIAGQFGVLARLELIKRIDKQLWVLQRRSGRARALAMLELYEETSRQRRAAMKEIAIMLGLTTGRVSQLVGDGRAWRRHDAAE